MSDVSKKIAERLTDFTEHLESGKPIEEQYRATKVSANLSALELADQADRFAEMLTTPECKADWKHLANVLRVQHAEIERLRHACSKQQDEIQQILGKALGYPAYDESVMPVPDSSVCVGDQVAESLASEAAAAIDKLQTYVGASHAWLDEAIGPDADHSADNLRLRVEALTKEIEALKKYPHFIEALAELCKEPAEKNTDAFIKEKNELLDAEIARLIISLHAHRCHPDYDYVPIYTSGLMAVLGINDIFLAKTLRVLERNRDGDCLCIVNSSAIADVSAADVVTYIPRNE